MLSQGFGIPGLRTFVRCPWPRVRFPDPGSQTVDPRSPERWRAWAGSWRPADPATSCFVGRRPEVLLDVPAGVAPGIRPLPAAGSRPSRGGGGGEVPRKGSGGPGAVARVACSSYEQAAERGGGEGPAASARWRMPPSRGAPRDRDLDRLISAIPRYPWPCSATVRCGMRTRLRGRRGGRAGRLARRPNVRRWWPAVTEGPVRYRWWERCDGPTSRLDAEAARGAGVADRGCPSRGPAESRWLRRSVSDRDFSTRPRRRARTFAVTLALAACP